jgi:hypothetical protein
MAQWPDNRFTTWLTYLIVFVGFPLLCLLSWWWVRR